MVAQVIVKLMGVILIACVASLGHAQNVKLSDLTRSDFEKLAGELTGNFMHTTVTGASSQASIFGFELGLVGGATSIPETKKLVERTASGADAEWAPHGSLIGILTVPFGISAEVGLIPTLGSSDFKFNAYSVAGKWTVTDVFVDLPVDLALKGFVTQTQLKLDQNSNGVSGEIEFTDTLVGAGAWVGKRFLIVEPYAALGWVRGDADLKVNGTGTVFAPSYTTAQGAGVAVSSVFFSAGVDTTLLFLKLGAEYTRVFDTNKYTAKLSFAF